MDTNHFRITAEEKMHTGCVELHVWIASSLWESSTLCRVELPLADDMLEVATKLEEAADELRRIVDSRSEPYEPPQPEPSTIDGQLEVAFKRGR